MVMNRFFRLEQHGTNIRTEVAAGITTFLTASYIIFVHPSILSKTGMDFGALTTVTCLVAAASTILIALLANAPIMMAPGMGLNAFFTYTLVLGEGVPWPTALGVVFISGLLFLLLTWVGLRERIALAIPDSLRVATSVGIGLFIAFIGFQNLGLIVRNEGVLVQIGEMTPTLILGLGGVLLAALLEAKRIRGALLLTILSITVAGILLGYSPVPDGVVAFPPALTSISFKLDILSALKFSLISSIFSFMFVDLFDTLGTLMAVCREAGMVDEQGDVKGLPRMLTADAIATLFGALFGTSTVTSYIESASGVSEGGRTGLTAIVTAALFIVALFFTPLIASVPTFATAPALVIVGIFMMRGISRIDFYDFEDGVPAFLTLTLMPLTYSIATGLSFGFMSYFLIKLFAGKIRSCDPYLFVAVFLSFLSLCF